MNEARPCCATRDAKSEYSDGGRTPVLFPSEAQPWHHEFHGRSNSRNLHRCSAETERPFAQEEQQPRRPLVQPAFRSFSSGPRFHAVRRAIFLTPNDGVQPRPVRSEATSRTSAATTGYTCELKLAPGSHRSTPLFSVFDAGRRPERKQQPRVRATRERQRAGFGGTAVGARSLSDTADRSAIFLCFPAPAFIEVRITLELLGWRTPLLACGSPRQHTLLYWAQP